MPGTFSMVIVAQLEIDAEIIVRVSSYFSALNTGFTIYAFFHRLRTINKKCLVVQQIPGRRYLIYLFGIQVFLEVWCIPRILSNKINN